MSKKKVSPPPIAPLQRVVAEPIIDPAECAALDKVRKRAKRAQVRLLNRNGTRARSVSPAQRRG